MNHPVLLLALLGAPAIADELPLRDPWLPPAAQRQAAPAPASRGQVLQAQIQAKLLREFQQADRAGRGALSLAEARAAGWGFAVEHFAAIDSAGRGEIRPEDLQRYLARRAAEARR